MNQSLTGSYEVAAGERAIYLRVHGLASMNNCLCVKEFLDEVLRACRRFVIVDLADCTGMDSTFMGVIARAAMFRKENGNVGVAIVNANEQSIKLIESLGLSELVHIERAPFFPEEVKFVELREEPNEAERLRMIRSAHQCLIAVSAENEKLFGPLVEEVEREMKARGLI